MRKRPVFRREKKRHRPKWTEVQNASRDAECRTAEMNGNKGMKFTQSLVLRVLGSMARDGHHQASELINGKGSRSHRRYLRLISSEMNLNKGITLTQGRGYVFSVLR